MVTYNITECWKYVCSSPYHLMWTTCVSPAHRAMECVLENGEMIGPAVLKYWLYGSLSRAEYCGSCYCFRVEVKWSRYRPDVTQRVGRGVALLFHNRGTRRGRVVSSTPRPHFTPGKDPVPILQEAGCSPGPVWTGGKSRPHRDSIPDRPACSQSLYRLSYPAHTIVLEWYR